MALSGGENLALTSSSECSTNTVTSTQKNSAVFIYRMLLFLLRRVNYIRFFITYYTFLISILCTTLRMSVFNKELLTYNLACSYTVNSLHLHHITRQSTQSNQYITKSPYWTLPAAAIQIHCTPAYSFFHCRWCLQNEKLSQWQWRFWYDIVV